MVRKGGLEPPHLSVPDPKSGASANSATFALALSELHFQSAKKNITCDDLRHSEELLDNRDFGAAGTDCVIAEPWCGDRLLESTSGISGRHYRTERGSAGC